MSYLPPSSVKQGFWIDWSQGLILGSTLTTSSKTGNVLLAFIAVVVSIACAHLWNLLLFAYYQSRSTSDQRDGLFRQQQALFRSLSSPESVLVDFSRLGWLWHGKARNATLRCFLPALIALLFFTAALLAGTFSSLIVSTTSLDVLVKSESCGYGNESYNYNAAVQSYLTSSFTKSQAYAKNCYSKTALSTSCDSYVIPRIRFSEEATVCPFSDSVCKGTGLTATTLDTGLLDSNSDFGINAKAGDRVQYRMKTTCAPLQVPGYYTVVDTSEIRQYLSGAPSVAGDQTVLYHYGSLYQDEGPITNIVLDSSTTFSNLTQQYTTSGSWTYPGVDSYSAFKPIEGLARSDADTSLVFVFNNHVISLEPIDDPVFSAHKKTYWICSTCPKNNNTGYIADEPAGVVGCAEQYQFCIPSANNGMQCTTLGGLPIHGYDDILPSANAFQKATIKLIVYAAEAVNMGVIGLLKPPTLQAQDTLELNIQNKRLPDDQWKTEVAGWLSVLLSTVQTILTDHALGPLFTKENAYIKVPPSTPSEKLLCESQKMKISGGFTNINVFGLAFTIAISCLLILMDLGVLKFVIYMSKFRPWAPRVDSWIQDGVLQLQRKAYEGKNEGLWTRQTEEIPLTGKNEMLSEFSFEPPRSAFCSTVSTDTGTIDEESTAKDILVHAHRMGSASSNPSSISAT